MKLRLNSQAKFVEYLTAIVNGTLKPGDYPKELFPLAEEILSNKRKISNAAFIASRALGAGTTKVIQSSDIRNVGAKDLAQAKLEKDEFFFVTGIQIQTAVLGATPTDVLIASNTAWTSVKNIAQLNTGRFSLLQQQKPEIQDMAMTAFANDQDTTELNGLFSLDKGILLVPQQLIEANIELQAAPTANTVVLITFHGAKTIVG